MKKFLMTLGILIAICISFMLVQQLLNQRIIPQVQGLSTEQPTISYELSNWYEQLLLHYQSYVNDFESIRSLLIDHEDSSTIISSTDFDLYLSSLQEQKHTLEQTIRNYTGEDLTSLDYTDQQRISLSGTQEEIIRVALIDLSLLLHSQVDSLLAITTWMAGIDHIWRLMDQVDSSEADLSIQAEQLANLLTDSKDVLVSLQGITFMQSNLESLQDTISFYRDIARSMRAAVRNNDPLRERETAFRMEYIDSMLSIWTMRMNDDLVFFFNVLQARIVEVLQPLLEELEVQL